ncbi:ATP-dependent RNA helicase DbpA [Alteromonas sp. C1M14]|uniref:ATP-dependent RNA helicase DbpA n=1 Tax=Alteromonas sp. C1M14 TaxID=2841567 RepID=UPI001C09DE20|nr:ATP-dependent RNA helicase DbpA [Alteromonas sp. C1M14]MBU2980160.1 ATP-dependent RNA helicase DbpA [Alteromonas sp. C1M14]
MNQFSDISTIRDELQTALSRLGFPSMTSVQAGTLPAALDGKDIMAQGQTGSGKTIAFAVATLNTVTVSQFSTQVLVLCPTRELAAQVAQQYREVGQCMANLKVQTLCGGEPMGPQIQSLKHGAHVVVGTPGRILDHLQKRRLRLDGVISRVLDEADRMLDMGFAEDVDAIFDAMPSPVQTLLFSATWTSGIQNMAARYLHQAHEFLAKEKSTSNPDIEQRAFSVEEHTRLTVLKGVLTTLQPTKAILFCNTRRRVVEVTEALVSEGFSAAGLQGDMEQRERTEVLARFAAEALSVLVGTDVAARGLDIKEVDCVINVDISEDVDTHTHRVGRTGRAGTKGLAVSLVGPSEQDQFTKIEAFSEVNIPLKGGPSVRFHANRIKLPEYVCLHINAGKKQKLRPGDFLGSLVKDAELPADDIGKIQVQNAQSFVSVKARSVKRALKLFREGKIKGKRVRARKLG